MKKRFIVMLLLLTGIFVQAQIPGIGESDDWKEKKLKAWFSVYMGLNCSSIGGDSESYDGSLLGLNIGLRMNMYKFNENLGINVEANFSQHGGKYEMEGYYEPGNEPYGQGGSGKVRLNYINLPITGRYQGDGGFYGEAGVQPGFLVSAKDKFEGSTTDMKDQVKKFDFSLLAGVGYQFKNRLALGLRAIPGLSNINKSENGYRVNKDRNFVLSLQASYSF